MSINIFGNFNYDAEINRCRYELNRLRALEFLVKALFRKNIVHVSDDLFQGKTVELDDITYYINDGNPDFIYIIKVDELKYLMNSSFIIISDGYYQIVQLHDKSPQFYGYIAVKKSEENDHEKMCWGVLDNHGKELIECKYHYIHPIVCRTVLRHDGDYVSGLASRRDDILFFHCQTYRGGCDVYTNNGTLVFENVDRMNITEEKILYDYDNYEDDWIYTETKQLEKIHVGLWAQHDEDTFELCVRYVYHVDLNDRFADLRYIGIEEADQRDIERKKAYGFPEILTPNVSRIELNPVKEAFKEGEKTVLYGFLRKLTKDVAIYNDIEECEVDFYFECFFFPKFSTYDAERKKEKLKYGDHEAMIDEVSNAIETILSLRLENAEREERKRQLAIEKTKRAEAAEAKWIKEKNEHQSQITLDTKLKDCYFGSPYNDWSSEATVGDLCAFNGEAAYEICNCNKELFEEIVTVLASHHIYFVDCPLDANIQSYIEKIYENYSPKRENEDVLSKTIEDLDLSVRSINVLKRAGVFTVENLIQYSASEIKQFRNIGIQCYEEILKKVEDLGVSLKQDE